jgi:hypothetical protein
LMPIWGSSLVVVSNTDDRSYLTSSLTNSRKTRMIVVEANNRIHGEEIVDWVTYAFALPSLISSNSSHSTGQTRHSIKSHFRSEAVLFRPSVSHRGLQFLTPVLHVLNDLYLRREAALNPSSDDERVIAEPESPATRRGHD